MRKGKIVTAETKLRNKDGNTSLLSKTDLDEQKFNSLGASFSELNSAEKVKYQINNGVKISSIDKNGKFAQTDIPEGFIVTKANKKNINSIDDLKEVMNNAKGNVMLEGIVPGYPGKYYFSFGL